ncbi:hypothetical protein IV203_029514 [Nitzschia inconspicua]|uniref:Uncharacterized protein n=1 Tax=Nitzschia inconspicua TaxID=303405 RepID=A0A9K3LQS0_9STRA|nr:hypothetical protein IV203_029514 [Nitzschia inconspicua]
MSDSLRKSIEYNNTACVHIQNGKFVQAADVLDIALRFLKSHLLSCQSSLHEMEEPGVMQEEHSCGDSLKYVEDLMMESPSSSREEQQRQIETVEHQYQVDLCMATTKEILKSVPVAKVSPGQLSINDVPSFDIYNKAFLLSPGDLDISSDEDYRTFENVENWISVVLMYNTALVHYNIGAAANMCVCDLHRSLKFFQIADEMLDMMARPFDFDILLLTSATANNMGHICICLHYTDRAKIHYKFLEGVLQVLQWMPQLDEEDYCLFFMNTGLHVDSLKASPAA